MTVKEHLAAFPLGLLAVSLGHLIARASLDSWEARLGTALLIYLFGATLVAFYAVGKQRGRAERRQGPNTSHILR